MWKYVLKRMGLAVVTSFIILSLSFILIKLLPFQKPAGTNAMMFTYYQQEVNRGFVTDLEYEDPTYGKVLWSYKDSANQQHVYYKTPILKQYGSWLKNIVTKWDWGQSTYILPNNPALPIITSKLPTSMKLNILSVIFSVPIGILLGIIAALNKNRKTDHIISTTVMIFISIPSFVLITMLMLLFCYTLKWLPSTWPASTAKTSAKILGYIIPVMCLSFGSICGYARFTRAELCEVMESDYLLLARTKGLTKRQAILRHALRNAMVPIVPSILAEFIGILGGSMILEKLYSIPGIGSLFIEALNQKDYNVLFVDMALFTTIGLLAGVILDISYGFIDPRIRMGAKK